MYRAFHLPLFSPISATILPPWVSPLRAPHSTNPDALPDSKVQVAISFLAELGEQEVLDAETAAKLDLARAEPGDDIPLDEVRRRLGL